MKMNIQITKIETGFLRNNEVIADIDINNGNWKYWDTHMECTKDEKRSLTINNIFDAFILNQPVKDAIALHDHKLWKEERKIVQTDASVRTYENLLGFLNCRINNAKEDYKKWGDKEKIYTAVLFEEEFYRTKDETVIRPITYEQDGVIEVKITIVE